MKKINMIVTIVMLIIGGVIGYKAFNLAADNGWVGSKKAVAEVKNDEAVAKNDVEMMPDGSTSDEIVPTDEESEDIAPAKEESEETVGNEVVPEPVQEPVIEEKPTVVREKQTEKKAPVAKESSKPVDNNKVYDIAEQMPSYPDGNSALQKYLADNLVYPESAERRGVEGTVIISFIGNTDESSPQLCLPAPSSFYYHWAGTAHGGKCPRPHPQSRSPGYRRCCGPGRCR